MAGSRRTRSGRQRANAGPTQVNARRKEDAELARISKTVTEIPSYSNRFQIFRVNRRQKAKKITEAQASSAAETAVQPPIFRAARFCDLPLSTRTLDGLAAADFSELTGIQKSAIPQALAGRDVLAAAPTGSGKTLAFLIPLLEVLWRHKWNTLDGLGALVLAPTRELGMQIFEVLRSIARKHMISAGLVIGGKDFESEREKVGQMNVLVATPGRILHHMDHVAELDCSNLKLLVLDEADRILDMGFAKTLDAILLNLPKERQTLLFSATQTKSVKALARLSLREPEYVAVASRESVNEEQNSKEEDVNDNEGASKTVGNDGIKIMGTPVGLSQSYAVVRAHDKLSVLWSFIRTHLKSKMIVFFSSGKQVRFAFETFCKLRPGMSLLHIHGNMKQLKRTDMYDVFCRTKSAALFATDVASRGLDFPDVEWVIQVDCPDDVGAYVHRVGRTARFKAHGRAMLFLNEGKEENFLEHLKARKLELHKTKINPNKVQSIEPRVSATVASNQELKKLAQRAFTFYIRSVFQQSDKEVFDINELDFKLLAKSFGLSVTPKISFKSDPSIKANDTRDSKEKNKSVFGYRLRPEQDSPAGKQKKGAKESTNPTNVVAELDCGDSASDDDDILTLKQVHNTLPATAEEIDLDGKDVEREKVQEQRKRKKRKLDLLKSMPSANRIIFTEDGQAVRAGDIADEESGGSGSDQGHDGIDDYAASVSKRLKETAEEDKGRERDRVRAMHARQRDRRRELNKIRRPSAEALALEPSGASDDDAYSSSDGSTPSSGGEDVGGDIDAEDVQEAASSLENDEKLALQILKSRM